MRPSCWLIARRRRKKARDVPRLSRRFFFDCKKGIRYSNKVERRQAISNSPRNYKLPKLPVTPSGSGGGGGDAVRSQRT